jgi:uncharacterized protein YuzE
LNFPSRTSKLFEAFPALATELVHALRNAGRDALAQQIDAATIARVTVDPDANAAYIYLDPSRALNVVETNIIGVRHGETIPVETSFWTVVDTDNFDRVAGIEIFDPGDLEAELMRFATG